MNRLSIREVVETTIDKTLERQVIEQILYINIKNTMKNKRPYLSPMVWHHLHTINNTILVRHSKDTIMKLFEDAMIELGYLRRTRFGFLKVTEKGKSKLSEKYKAPRVKFKVPTEHNN